MPENDKENMTNHFSDDQGRCVCYVNFITNLLPISMNCWDNIEPLCEQSFADVNRWGINDKVRERVEAEERHQLRSSVRRYTSSKAKL